MYISYIFEFWYSGLKSVCMRIQLYIFTTVNGHNRGYMEKCQSRK